MASKFPLRSVSKRLSMSEVSRQTSKRSIRQFTQFANHTHHSHYVPLQAQVSSSDLSVVKPTYMVNQANSRY